ncbi:MAG: xanthine dehydrogenase accessory protein XdhC [Roseobacter sp.]|jgi:xanthine dehydrogenase accessory factor|nr:xanthine dehydrogenase accessory protein XdhC [Roseobacter sp.]
MSFDLTALISACAAHGRVARVVVARVRGSAPREVGAAMLVWRDGFCGTIGGGTLEHEAMADARAQLDAQTPKLSRHALGPDLGQCCGGAVDLFTDVFDHATAQALPDGLILRGTGDMPLGVARLKAAFESHGHVPLPQLVDGWMVEPVHKPARSLWIWGAGHVGRAMVNVLSPLPDVATTWVDTDSTRFPADVAPHISAIAAAHPARLVAYAPADAEHLILTYSHDLDLELCHQLLRHSFRFAGLIGSATKWARFRSRLAGLGHAPDTISRITCPIGNPDHGKHPQAIAIGVAEAFLSTGHTALEMKGTA